MYTVFIESTNTERDEMKIIGLTDTVNICECCGKSGLARTVCFESNDGDLSFIGTTCSTKYAKKHGLNYGLKAVELINAVKEQSKTFHEFVEAMKGKGFGNVKTLSPIFGVDSAISKAIPSKVGTDNIAKSF